MYFTKTVCNERRIPSHCFVIYLLITLYVWFKIEKYRILVVNVPTELRQLFGGLLWQW